MKVMMKLSLSLILIFGLSLNLVAQNNPPSAADYTIEISELAATELTLDGSDADNDLIYFPIVRQTAHGLLTSTEDTLITGEINNLEAGPYGNVWMFDQTSAPFSNSNTAASVFAYTQLNWNADGHGDGSCESGGSGMSTLAFTFTENISMASGVYELDMFIDSLDFASQTHINTEDANDSWMTMGAAGEIRVYNQGTGGIKQNGVVKLAVDNLTLWLKIFYPSPIGAGGAGGYASGFGVASIDQAASDPAWVAEFDPNGTGFIEIAFESFSQTVQTCYGAYDIVGISLQPISDAAITYTPEPGFIGVDNFSYVVFDGQSFSDEIQVTLNVGVTDPVGAGTEADPFQIEVLDDLLWISEHSEHWGDRFIQTADINAAATATWNGGLGFTAIGTDDTRFTGHYDGQGFTLDSLTIVRPNADDQGMFGYAYGGTLNNIGLTNVNISGATYTGGLVGHHSANINNCFTTGTVTGLDNTGGLIGIAIGTVYGSYSECTVSGADKVGGLVGNSMNTIYGVHDSYSTGDVSGNDVVGGFVGNAWSRIENCYSTGNVSRSLGTSVRVAGFAGVANAAIVIKYSYSTGTVSFPGDTAPTDKGFVGSDESAVFWDNFFDTEVSGQATAIGATGKTTAEMTTLGTYTVAGWDFEIEGMNGDNNNWDMDNVNGVINGGYPFLSWENGDNIAINPGIAPVVAAMDLHTGIDEVLEFTLAGTDADSDELIYTLWDWTLTGGAELVDSVVTYTPPAGYQGTETFQYQAYDGFTYSDLATITITVSNINLPPVADIVRVGIPEDVIDMGILMSATDAENDSITFSIVEDGAHGHAWSRRDAMFYTPEPNYNGPDTIWYEARDAFGGDTAYVYVDVLPQNDAPEAVTLLLPADNANILDYDITFTWDAAVDVDGDDLFYNLRIFNSNYDSSFNVGADLSFTTSALELPKDIMLAWTVEVSDSLETSLSATRLFTIDESVNLPPVADVVRVGIPEDVIDMGILMSATDAENDSITFSIVEDGAHGHAWSRRDAMFYTPEPNYNGPDTIWYEARDAFGSDTAYVYVNVLPENDAPGRALLLLPGENENIMNTSVTFTWEAATDVDGDELSYSIRIYNASYDSSYDVGSDLTFTTSTLDMPRGVSLEWTVEVRDTSLATLSEPFHLTVDQTVGIDDRNSLPESWVLAQNYPNPFNPSTTIQFSVPNTSAVRLTIYDISGREINRLVDGVKTQGNYSVVWNGTDFSQNTVSSGMYLFRLEGEGFSQIKRMLYLK